MKFTVQPMTVFKHSRWNQQKNAVKQIKYDNIVFTMSDYNATNNTNHQQKILLGDKNKCSEAGICGDKGLQNAQYGFKTIHEGYKDQQSLEIDAKTKQVSYC